MSGLNCDDSMNIYQVVELNQRRVHRRQTIVFVLIVNALLFDHKFHTMNVLPVVRGRPEAMLPDLPEIFRANGDHQLSNFDLHCDRPEEAHVCWTVC